MVESVAKLRRRSCGESFKPIRKPHFLTTQFSPHLVIARPLQRGREQLAHTRSCAAYSDPLTQVLSRFGGIDAYAPLTAFDDHLQGSSGQVQACQHQVTNLGATQTGIQAKSRNSQVPDNPSGCAGQNSPAGRAHRSAVNVRCLRHRIRFIRAVRAW